MLIDMVLLMLLYVVDHLRLVMQMDYNLCISGLYMRMIENEEECVPTSLCM
jgi:hypothetical protein